MSVPEVLTFAFGLRPILKHFKLCTKSSALLEALIEVMEKKPFKLMTWCPTQTTYLECSSRTDKIIFLICDMLPAIGIKHDETAYFFIMNHQCV